MSSRAINADNNESTRVQNPRRRRFMIMIQEVNAAQFIYMLDRRPLPVGADHRDIYACATIHHVLTDIYACAIIHHAQCFRWTDKRTDRRTDGRTDGQKNAKRLQ